MKWKKSIQCLTQNLIALNCKIWMWSLLQVNLRAGTKKNKKKVSGFKLESHNINEKVFLRNCTKLKHRCAANHAIVSISVCHIPLLYFYLCTTGKCDKFSIFIWSLLNEYLSNDKEKERKLEQNWFCIFFFKFWNVIISFNNVRILQFNILIIKNFTIKQFNINNLTILQFNK